MPPAAAVAVEMQHPKKEHAQLSPVHAQHRTEGINDTMAPILADCS